MEWWRAKTRIQKVGIVVGAVFALGIIGAIFDGEEEPAAVAAEPTTTLATSTTTTSTSSTTTTMRPTTTTTTPAPKPEDFEVELVVIEDQCFGSAGALVTVRPTVTYKGFRQMAGDWLLVYEVVGVEAGKETYNLSISDDEYTVRELVLSTDSCDHNLAALVTNILPD